MERSRSTRAEPSPAGESTSGRIVGAAKHNGVVSRKRLADAEAGGAAVEAPPAAALDRFSPLVREWFAASFAEPTPAQAGAWNAIARGENTLVVAPTGSGKTLAAFLSAIDTLVTAPAAESGARKCSVLYLSPLKALAVDVERNLRSPLVGIGSLAARSGTRIPEISVAVRSGDTPSGDRRAFAKDGADILITTPESLFLLLTSRAREMLTGITTVILDEVHAVAGSKRGAHLAVSLDRLDALLDRPAQRIGLSATVRPIEEVGRFLTGGRPVTLVRPISTKQIIVEVVVPVPDMSSLGEPSGDLTGAAAGEPARTSIWPHVEERVVDLIESHHSTIVFANSRRLAERLTARLNEIYAERHAAQNDNEENDSEGDENDGNENDRNVPPGPTTISTQTGPPAQLMAQSGATNGAPAVLARAHHGSVSREQRALIEDQLKTGLLPAVVATSSLELGVDMGAVDLVIQVEAPPSVASGLQRIGRAGHQVGAPSHGVIFPKYRGDLISTAVVAGRMKRGAIEAMRVLSNPLDIAAQQIVAICAMDSITVDELHELLRKSAPFASLGRGALESVLDMLSGRYPSEQFAELRPRLTWDRVTGELTGRPGAQRLAVTSGGTIPDRGMFGVFLAGGEGPGRRVGELDEEMVYESRVGDVFALGSSSWRILEITHDKVLVVPAPGVPGRLPFWKGDTLGRPAELGRAHGEFVREISGLPLEAAQQRLAGDGLDGFAADNLIAYLREQQDAVGLVPDEKTIVVERFRDELGDWRLVLHSPYGAAVHAPWALVVAARMRERFGVDVQAMHADDGIVLRLPDVEYEGELPEILDAIALDPETLEAEVTAEIGGSAVFASRFRECAARALLLPRRQIGQRQPLWQQRQRASQLLEVAAQYPTFPIVAEAVRECLSDVFDVPALVALMRQIAARSVRVVEVTTASPSPFARSLLFGYVAQFLYEGDSPLGERRAAALTVDPALLAELLGGGDGLSLRDLLDPQALADTEADLQRLSDNRRARSVDEIADLLRILGPLTTDEVAARVSGIEAPAALDQLEATRRAIVVRVGGLERWADPADAPLLRDALGTALPPGIAPSLLEPAADPLGRLLGRFARTRGPFVPGEAAVVFGLGVAVVTDALRRLSGSGRVAEGEFRPLGRRGTGAGSDLDQPGADGAREFVDAEVLRLLRRRSLAALRAEVEPVPADALGRFLPAWNGIVTSTVHSGDRGNGFGRAGTYAGAPVRARSPAGIDALLRAVEQLAGAILPASAIESLILPARVRGYTPAMLDELTSAGEVLWTGHGSLGGDDGWVSLHLADSASLTMALPNYEILGGAQACAAEPGEQPAEVPGELHRAVLGILARGGAFFFRALTDAVTEEFGSLRTDDVVAQALWDLVFAGLVTGDTLAPLRARLIGGRTTHKAKAPAPRIQHRGQSGLALLSAGWQRRVGPAVRRGGPPMVAGRWSLISEVETDPTVRAHAAGEVLLDRYGIVTRGAVVAEETPGGFAAVYKVMSAFEESGRVRRGYFIEGLGAAQFATAGAVDRVRAFVGADADRVPGGGLVLAAADPANPFGAALPWPDRGGEEKHRPARRAGALVVLVDGAPVLYAERGGRTLMSFSTDTDELQEAARALGDKVIGGAIGSLTITKVDGVEAVSALGPVVDALTRNGFTMTPQGLRLRSTGGRRA
jgi:ATP-dependent Lhr-like helicase